MDTERMEWYDDPIYITMCEKAERIQSLWKPSAGDWYIHDYRGTTKTSREFEKQIWGDSDKTWKAVEILCYRPSESRDVVVSTDGEKSICVSVADLVRKHALWLPRQDQLQEMIVKEWGCIVHQVFYMFCEWLKEIPVKYHNTFLSMEQFWLAFVMHRKYGKVWDLEKTDWVKEQLGGHNVKACNR